MNLLPLGYVLRNVLRRRARSLVTILGIAATTMLVVAMQSFASGLERAGAGSVRDDVVVVLGASSEADLVRSVVPRGSAEVVAASAPGVATRGGVRAASVELHIATRRGNQVGLLRGVTDAAYAVHTPVTVVEGREPRGPFELVVGALAATRMGLAPDELRVGATIELERRPFTVVGRFAAPGTAYEAEMWGRLGDVMLATRREDVSCVVLRLDAPENLGDVQLFTSRRIDLEVVAMPERELVRTLTASLEPVVALAHWMAVLAVVAGAFACANTMFAAVLARTRELATLRSIGYTPPALAVSIVLEAVFVAFAGGALGMLVAMAFGGVSLRYPMGALRLEADETSRALGLAAAVASGVLGGIVPAVRAVRIPLVEAIGGRS